MNWFGRSHDDPAAAPSAPSEAAAQPDAVRMTAFVHGHVQGVGFRWFTRTQAMELGLVGSATNLADGRVEVVAEGPRADCDRLLVWLRGGRTPGHVDQVVEQFAPARGTFKRFDVG